MDLIFRPYSLKFRHPFGVSSNSRTETTSVFLRLEHGGQVGYGEACLPAYLGESVESTLDFLSICTELLRTCDSETLLPEVISAVDKLREGHNAAKAAIDIALHDLHAKILGVPVYEMLCLPDAGFRATSFTIALDSADKLQQKIIEADDYKILKIKAGTSDDKKLIRQIRKYTYKPLYVDVNQGWRNKHMALDMIGWMKDQGVALVEQPLPSHMLDDMAWITEKSPLPVVADESFRRLGDLERIEGAFSCVNIKLMKCTGLFEAIQVIAEARRRNLKIMLGCMAESSCAVAAMTQLLGHADYVDLDAPRLYLNDPFSGLEYVSGQVRAPLKSGIGVVPAAGFFT